MAFNALVIRQNRRATDNPTTIDDAKRTGIDPPEFATDWDPLPIPIPTKMPEEMRQQTSAKAQDEEPSETTLFDIATFTEEATTTMTDSGRTITVPNDEVVTITRHTLIITDKPPDLPTTMTTSTVSSSVLAEDPFPTPQETDNASGDGATGLSAGTLAGIGISGAVVVALLVVLIIFIKRRRNKQQDESDSTKINDSGREDGNDEKVIPKMSPHTTGTQVEDPFAPFGGRVDKETEAMNRPPSNVFEMDATSAVPVELPAISPGANPRRRSSSTTNMIVSPLADSPVDPLANLNSIGRGEGRYVNHWNQYRAMGSGTG